ncbi:MAG TPA: HAD hydrolase-like protein, partial [Intrasporangium sp.]|nr:HAD hydrolase-like protein [Intrasporangium sp.]
RAAYVGDAVVDVLAGKAAGMATIAVTWGAGVRANLDKVRPDGIATTTPELRDLLLVPQNS